MSSRLNLVSQLVKSQDKKRAVHAVRFFKTAPGQYGYGDIFLGISVPVQRHIAKQYLDLSFADLQILLNSPIHEHRFVALVILVHQYEKGDNITRKKVYEFYLRNTHRINNWDLVDVSAPRIVGAQCVASSTQPLYKLAVSKSLWERRIAMVATLACIRAGIYKPTHDIAVLLLSDKEDLMHKACGWMLREMGKRNEKALRAFLDTYASRMPRTMLRYSIERLSQPLKKKYMAIKLT